MNSMKDAIECARIVFGKFQQTYDEHPNPTATWIIRFPRGRDYGPLGLSAREGDLGIKVLEQKGLIEMMGIGAYRLAKHGQEVCLHPGLLDDYLAPRRPLHADQSVTINAENMHNTQVGNHNIQNITFQSVLTSLIAELEKSPEVSPTQKRNWTASLREIAAHPVTQTVIGAAATLAAAAAGK